VIVIVDDERVFVYVNYSQQNAINIIIINCVLHAFGVATTMNRPAPY